MLRITVVDSSDSGVRLRVEGRLTGPSVEELHQSCELHALSDGAQLTLDLVDISFADADGVELLRDLRNRDVAVVNLPRFLALQLRDSKSGKLPPQYKDDAPERKG
jgi:anti-anti-sigma regulatory factor